VREELLYWLLPICMPICIVSRQNWGNDAPVEKERSMAYSKQNKPGKGETKAKELAAITAADEARKKEGLAKAFKGRGTAVDSSTTKNRLPFGRRFPTQGLKKSKPGVGKADPETEWATEEGKITDPSLIQARRKLYRAKHRAKGSRMEVKVTSKVVPLKVNPFKGLIKEGPAEKEEGTKRPLPDARKGDKGPKPKSPRRVKPLPEKVPPEEALLSEGTKALLSWVRSSR